MEAKVALAEMQLVREKQQQDAELKKSVIMAAIKARVDLETKKMETESKNMMYAGVGLLCVCLFCFLLLYFIFVRIWDGILAGMLGLGLGLGLGLALRTENSGLGLGFGLGTVGFALGLGLGSLGLGLGLGLGT